MNKLFTVFAFCLLTTASNAQVVFSSSFENWTGSDPTDWMGTRTNIPADSVNQITSGIVYGTFGVQLKNMQSGHERFTTQPMTVDSATTYDITFWVRGHGEIRTSLYDGRATGFGYATYNSYIAVNSSSWAQYTQSITCANDTVAGEFIISIRNTFADLNHIELDSVVIEAVTVPMSSIYSIQYTTAPGGDSPLMNQSVVTSGIVTAKYTSGYFIQDGVGMWTGLHVYDPTNAATVQLGDSVVVGGTVAEYFNMTQLGSVVSFGVVSSGNPLPTASVINTATVKTEPYEGVLVQTLAAMCTDNNAGFGMWAINNGGVNDTCKVHNLIFNYTPTFGNYYNVRGVSYYSFNEFRIEPRDINDIQNVTGVFENENSMHISVYPNPTQTTSTITWNGKISKMEIYNAAGQLVQTVGGLEGKTQTQIQLREAGLYIAKLVTAEGMSHSVRVVRE